MRIVLVADFYPPHIGGVELQVRALGQALVARGHDVHVVTVWQEGLARDEDDGGVAVHRLRALFTRPRRFSGDPSRRYHPPFPDPELAWGLRRLMGRLRPHALMAHGWSAYSAALATAGTGVPLVLSVRDYGYACATRSLLLDGRICSGPAAGKCHAHAARVYGPGRGLAAATTVLASRPLLRRRVAAVHAVSRFVAEETRRDLLAGRPVPVATIPDIIVESAPPAAAAAPLALPDRPYLLFVGALQPHKGLGPLLEAHGLLPDPPPLVLIGTRWPDTPAFPAGVTVLENVPHAQVLAAWDGALFGIAPSVWPDPLPGVIREAMRRGRPVIGTRIGGIPDIVRDGETGLLVPPGDAAALATAMGRLLDDAPLRERLGANARVDAARYTPSRVAAEFEALYRAHLGRGRRWMPDGGLPPGLRRVHITGTLGTGKSYLARRLGEALRLPVHHLDEIARSDDGRLARPMGERLALVDRIADAGAWITEGAHVGWTDRLVREADLVIWLDHVGRIQAARRVIRRALGGWADETRRGGIRRLFRFRDYARNLADLARAVGEIRRYEHDGPADGDGTLSREAARLQLAAHGPKVAHVRRASDLDALVEALGATAPGPRAG